MEIKTSKSVALEVETVVFKKCGIRHDPSKDYFINENSMVSDAERFLSEYGYLNYDNKLKTVISRYNDYGCYNDRDVAENFLNELKSAL